MKSLLTIFPPVFTVMFSSTSFGGWTFVGENQTGTNHYVDIQRIRKHGGYIYWWSLLDYVTPHMGDLSVKRYIQSDCKLFRYKFLSVSFHKEPMGGGTGYTPPVPKEHKDWKYPPPNSSVETILKSVCSR